MSRNPNHPLAFYNEINKYAAQWLRNLIAAGHIAPGVVDERSIEDITPDELRGYTQCHFFAGIGVWSLALRAAGWPDDRPIWTGSCPCQPFSAAGAGAGFADERHLWPAFHHLIAECRPAVVAGEQVASKAVDPWIDLVQDDLEALGYAVGAVAFPSAGVGAPHIRDRTYWVADANSSGRQQFAGVEGHASLLNSPHDTTERIGESSDLCASAVRLANAQLQQRPNGESSIGAFNEARGRKQGSTEIAGLCSDLRAGPTNGKWRYADWLGCTDGKWRPVEPGTFPLVDGDSSRVGRLRADQERLAALVPRKDQGSRVGRLRGYGNAINKEAARVFIECAYPELEL